MPNDDGVHRTEQMETNTIPNREFFVQIRIGVRQG